MTNSTCARTRPVNDLRPNRRIPNLKVSLQQGIQALPSHKSINSTAKFGKLCNIAGVKESEGTWSGYAEANTTSHR